MNRTELISTLFFCMMMTCISCVKKDYPRTNLYDSSADVTRNYSLVFDHIEVVDESATVNINGLLDVVEIAWLKVYMKNTGTDPCLLKEGTFEEVGNTSGFYIYNSQIGTNEGFTLGASDVLGYDVRYIDPGATDYLKVKVRTYSSLSSNIDIPCVFMLTDYDGQIHQVDFNVHIE